MTPGTATSKAKKMTREHRIGSVSEQQHHCIYGEPPRTKETGSLKGRRDSEYAQGLDASSQGGKRSSSAVPNQLKSKSSVVRLASLGVAINEVVADLVRLGKGGLESFADSYARRPVDRGFGTRRGQPNPLSEISPATQSALTFVTVPSHTQIVDGHRSEHVELRRAKSRPDLPVNTSPVLSVRAASVDNSLAVSTRPSLTPVVNNLPPTNSSVDLQRAQFRLWNAQRRFCTNPTAGTRRELNEARSNALRLSGAQELFQLLRETPDDSWGLNAQRLADERAERQQNLDEAQALHASTPTARTRQALEEARRQLLAVSYQPIGPRVDEEGDESDYGDSSEEVSDASADEGQ
ncbi:hypothetical protein B0H12DRAFT_1074015 [Mycena haematopus]|nr:hypothetical protein B0H12DRAFT_1074015 [Mycena haematopus]